MNLLPARLRTRKSVVIIALCFLLVVGGVLAYFFIPRGFHPGEAEAQQIASLEKTIAQKPDDPTAYVALALLYSQAGAPQRAITQLNIALKLNPSHQGALVALGDAYMELERYKDAVEPYTKVVDLNTHNPMRGISRELEGVYYHLGTAYFKLGSFNDALHSFSEALAIDAADADAWYMMGNTLQKMSNFARAIESYEEAVRFVPNFKESYQGMAECYEKLGQASFAQYANAMVAYSSGSPRVAITQLEKVIAAKPDFAEAYQGLGLAYEAVGEKAKAMDFYRQALSIKPGLWLSQAKLGMQ